MRAYTDYPLIALGDIGGQEAPIREVEPLAYDQNKYVLVRFEGKIFNFKAGYLYSEFGRCGEAKKFDVSILPLPSEVEGIEGVIYG